MIHLNIMHRGLRNPVSMIENSRGYYKTIEFRRESFARSGGEGSKLMTAEKQKGRHLSTNPFFIWLPDLGSNQGHTD
jgi:hypothetical protein